MTRIFYLVIPVVLLLPLSGCDEQPEQLHNGQSAPAFDLQSMMSEKIVFPADLEGKVVAIRFWADWCPFCESEMRALEPVYQKLADKGLVVLAVNVRQDLATVKHFIGKMDISYDVLLDPEGEVARQYGVMGLPTTFFITRDGMLKSRILGESTPETFEQVIKSML